MRGVRIAFLLTVLLAPAGLPQTRDLEIVQVQRKLALVIGNTQYPKGSLRNPVNDAMDMKAVLEELGFKVIDGYDLTHAGMDQLIEQFIAQLGRGDLGLFFYAGHGLQLSEENYLVPIDYKGASESDAKYAAVPASSVRDRMEESGARLRLIILDACRNNPYRTRMRGGRLGLAPMRLDAADAEGTLIAFATSHNSVADDSPAERNGLYTKHLLSALRATNLKLLDVFEQVRQEVYRASGRKQIPTFYSNVVGTFYFRAGPVVELPLAKPPPDPETAYWNSIKGSQDLGILEAYLRQHPSGQYSEIARTRIAALRVEPNPVPRPVNPPVRLPYAAPQRMNPKDGLTYQWVPAGAFRMGCSAQDRECDSDENPAHPVKISSGFWLGQTEVTVAAYKRFARESARSLPGEPKGTRSQALNPGWADGQAPMVNVSWDDADQYCRWAGGRLPTETEWEYAARGGSPAARYGEADQIAWHRGNSGAEQGAEGVRPVRGKTSNAFGLHDMLGNAAEWVADWYEEAAYGQTGDVDPQGPSTGARKTVRGGNTILSPDSARASNRLSGGRNFRSAWLGFRCAGEVKPGGAGPLSSAPAMGTVYLSTEPAGASVTVNDQLWPAKTPAQLRLSPGVHRIVIQLGNRYAEETVTVREGDIQQLSFPLPR
ncbi:MAG: SUMF1/EgtB/PvdO family nonheme iron enzyme [Bryobacteraceae bacterium]